MFQTNMAGAVCENWNPAQPLMFEFQKFNYFLVHHYTVLSLDPQYQNLKKTLMRFYMSSADGAQKLPEDMTKKS